VGFIREHAIVGLAVGFVIGTQVQTVVKQLVASFIDPAFELLFGSNLTNATYTWHFHGRYANFGWGAFVYGLLDFLFVLIAIYALIKFFKLDKLDKPKL
jgi:large-conductance mechanosensitive channel